jgi:predicted transcriptional regulator
VIGCVRIKLVLKLPIQKLWREHGLAACVTKREFDAYFSGLAYGFAIVIDNVRAFSRQLKADYLEERFGIVPPQSYRYLTPECVASLRDE